MKQYLTILGILLLMIPLGAQNLDEFWLLEGVQHAEAQVFNERQTITGEYEQLKSSHSPNVDDQIAAYKDWRAKNQRIQLRQANTPTVWVPVQFHIAMNTAGYGAMTPYTLAYYFTQINAHLEAANVQLYQCGPINYITDNAIYTLPYGNVSVLDNHDVAGVMNLYFVDQLSNYCGSADYPGVGERIIYATDCFGFEPVTVLTHLIGQFFSLYPTHGTSSTGPELVARTNCLTAGDELCDTPADPNLFTTGFNSTNCQYTGTAIDANNQPYTPDTTNFMSYATWSCRDHFTPDQLARLYHGATVDRANLTGCTVTASCANPVSQYPYQEGFENGWNGWQQTEIDYYDFALQTGGTPTVGTGPGQAAEGTQYMYSEATGNFGGTAILSPCFDFTGMSQPTLSFQYHMHGTDINYLGIQISLDGGFLWYGPNSNNFLDQVTGDQGNSWKTHAVDLSAYANEPSFRFRFVAVLSNTGDLQDIAIDDIIIDDACFPVQITTTPTTCHHTNDGGAALTYPPQQNNLTINWSTGATGTSSLQNLAPGTYSVTITDNGSCTIVDTFVVFGPDSLYLELTGQEPTTTNNGVIESVTYGGTPPYTYTWADSNVDTPHRTGLQAGYYEVTVTDVNGCMDSTIIYLGNRDQCNGTKRNNWPYHVNFERGTRMFRQNQDDDRNWARRKYQTPTQNTGPLAAAQGLYYRYFETTNSNAHPYKSAVLTTNKCLDFSNLQQPELAFQYHMYGAEMGTLSVQVHDGIGWRNAIWQRTGDQGNQWHQATIDLSAYQNTIIRLRIVGISGSGQLSDMAIDDLWIRDGSQNSLQVASVKPKVNVEQPISVIEKWTIYPNPAKNQLQLHFVEGLKQPKQMMIKDGLGRTVLQTVVEQSKSLIQIGHLKPGIYYVIIEDSAGTLKTEKLVVMN